MKSKHDIMFLISSMGIAIMTETIIYEQPLNEILRVCLRLEHMFNQIEHQCHDQTQLGIRSVLNLIISILQLVDRPDLKAKMAKEIQYQHGQIARYQQKPGVDTEALQTITQDLNRLATELIDTNGKIGHKLRDIELLNTLRLHLANPGGGCSFDLPVLHYWLQQPSALQLQLIQTWLQEFNNIKAATTLILQLVRQNARIEEKLAQQGFYQEMLDAQANLRMIRIALSHDIAAFPEISVGRHFLSARFFIPSIEKRPVQYEQDLLFNLAYCF